MHYRVRVTEPSSSDPSRAVLRSAADLRAVAHPTRLRLLGALRMHGPQTGAMLGERVGEAAGTVSYHLRTLAKAGLVTDAEPQSGDRRERWWAAAHESTSWDPVTLRADPEQAAASAALQRVVGEVYAQRWAEYVDAAGAMPDEWVAAGLSTDSVLRLTVEELAELREELMAVSSRWRALSAGHVAGDGSEPAALIAQAYRIPAP